MWWAWLYIAHAPPTITWPCGKRRTVLFISSAGQAAMEAGEVEFLAEKELVTITPNFSENKITMISVSEVATPLN